MRVKQLNSIREIDTTAQAASLRTLQELITMIDRIIDELTGTTPQVMPTQDKKDIHSTLGGLAMMREESMQPINTKVKFYLEPALRKILGIIYRHNIQYFKKESALRILGDKAEKFDLDYIKKSDIMMKGNPDFIPTGISGFLERMAEVKSLLEYMKILAGITVPIINTDMLGNEKPEYAPDGKVAMKPYGNIAYIARRIGELLRVKEIDEIAPEPEKVEKPKPLKPKMLNAPPPMASPSGATGQPTPTGQSEGYLGMAGGGMKGD